VPVLDAMQRIISTNQNFVKQFSDYKFGLEKGHYKWPCPATRVEKCELNAQK
jgi:hypothetical protein